MKRVLAVIHGPAFGGAHRQVVRLRRKLRQRGYEVVAAVPATAPAVIERLRIAGVETYGLPLARFRRSLDPRLFGTSALSLIPEALRLSRLVRDADIDIVQAHGIANPHAFIAASATHRPLVLQLIDTNAPALLRRALRPILLSQAAAIMCTGSYVASFYLGHYANRAILFVPPVSAAEYRPPLETDRLRVRSMLGITEDTVLVGTVGNINHQKRHDFLVASFVRAMARTHVPLALRIFGATTPGHEQTARRLDATLRSLALPANTVSAVPPGLSVSELLRGFDIFALTSAPRSEGLPTVIIEAMLTGLPILATNVGGVPELLADMPRECLVDAMDLNSYAQALADLASDTRLRQAIAIDGRRSATRRFSIHDTLDAYVTAYTAASSRPLPERA